MFWRSASLHSAFFFRSFLKSELLIHFRSSRDLPGQISWLPRKLHEPVFLGRPFAAIDTDWLGKQRAVDRYVLFKFFRPHESIFPQSALRGLVVEKQLFEGNHRPHLKRGI